MAIAVSHGESFEAKTRRSWTRWLRSHPLRLSFSAVLLMLSVLFFADLLGLRSSNIVEIKDARALVTQSLALQLSTLASIGELQAIEDSVKGIVLNNDDVLAASLLEVSGHVVASYGDTAILGKFTGDSTLTQISVPIFSGSERWGEVRMGFTDVRHWKHDLGWFAFIAAAGVLVLALFFNRALMQLDPSNAVPERVDSAFNLFSEGVVILDDQLRVVMANIAAAELVNLTPKELIGIEFDKWAWQRDASWQAPWTTTLHSGLDIADKEVRLNVGNDTRLFMVSCSPVGDAGEKKHGVLVTLDDMTVVQKKNQELAQTLKELRLTQENINAKNRELEVLATRDPLTGLHNRRVLMDNLEMEFNKAKTEGTVLSCIMVDIDYFKKINDNHGHAVGDDILRVVAKTLSHVCREYDTIGRYGGEEFVLLFPGQSANEVLDIANRARFAITRLIDLNNIALTSLSASFGIADMRSSARNGSELLDQADQALYDAKQNGRNRVCVYKQEILPVVSLEREAADSEEDIPLNDSLVRLKELEALVSQRTDDLNKLREFDILTGVPLRDLFLQRVDSEISRSQRLSTTVGVMSFELRDLPLLIATFGHTNTDALVVEFVARVHEGLRVTDTVCEITGDHNLSRLTTNEYGVLLADLQGAEGAMPVISRLRRLLSQPFQVGEERVYIGACIGIAIQQDGDVNGEALLESAGRVRSEAALSPDKVSHCFASDQLDIASQNYIRLESDLHDARERNQLAVHFQPKYDVLQRRITGVEALLRWLHADDGYISPAEFIPVAEANGLIGDLYEFVLEESVKHMAAWQELGFDNLGVSINISPVQLRDPKVVDYTLKTLRESGIDTKHFEIELTETAVIENRERASHALHRLRDAGIKISMDDFGTGYTSLALLADLPLDTVKIDRSFVIAMEGKERSRAIVESVINMAHALRLRVVGEGIETNEQLATLTALGCDEIQGYLISRPLPGDELVGFLQHHRQQLLRRQA